MRTVHTNVYVYDELSDDAKEKARDWYREASAGDDWFAESVTDAFQEVAKACGFSISGTNPNNRSDKGIYWEGFSHQGARARFSGSWSAAHVDVAALLKDRPAKYTDADGKEHACESNAELAVILEAFASLAADEPTGYGNVSASHRGHSLAVDYGHESDTREEWPTELEEQFKELCDDLAAWLYRCLEREYEYHNSNENVAESIRANEYEFTADGRRTST